MSTEEYWDDYCPECQDILEEENAEQDNEDDREDEEDEPEDEADEDAEIVLGPFCIGSLYAHIFILVVYTANACRFQVGHFVTLSRPTTPWPPAESAQFTTGTVGWDEAVQYAENIVRAALHWCEINAVEHDITQWNGPSNAVVLRVRELANARL